MAVGSLPLTDPDEAVAFVLRYTPEVIAWPQLPRRSYLENMYVQFAEGLPGLVIDTEKERLFVYDEPPTDELLALAERLASDDPQAFAISPEYAAGLEALTRALTATPTQAPFVKGQVTGPVSLGLSIPREDRRALFYDDTLRDAAVQLLAGKARWQNDLLARLAPDSTPIVMVDEPYLTQAGSALISIPEDISLPALETCLSAIDGLAGIHVCGGTDWAGLTRLSVDLLDFDAADHLDSILTQREAVAAFLQQGGLLCWGVVPNDQRAGEWTAEEAGRRVLTGAEALAAAGAPTAETILAGSFVAPACGTGALTRPAAEAVFTLTAQTSSWLRARI